MGSSSATPAPGAAATAAGSRSIRTLQPQQPSRITAQDEIEILRRKVQLFDEGVRVLDISSGEYICPDDNSIRSDLADQESKRFRIIVQLVVMDSAVVLSVLILDL